MIAIHQLYSDRANRIEYGAQVTNKMLRDAILSIPNEELEQLLVGPPGAHFFGGWCQTNQLKHQKPVEREFYEAIRERHSVRAASRFSLKVLRVDSDLCELK